MTIKEPAYKEDRRDLDHIRQIVVEVVEETVPVVVKQTLLAMGINPDHPLEAQNDMSFLRSMRTRCEKIGAGATMAFITITVGGVLSVFVLGVKDWITNVVKSLGGH
jgi:hypothetical protein